MYSIIKNNESQWFFIKLYKNTINANVTIFILFFLFYLFFILIRKHSLIVQDQDESFIKLYIFIFETNN